MVTFLHSSQIPGICFLEIKKRENIKFLRCSCLYYSGVTNLPSPSSQIEPKYTMQMQGSAVVSRWQFVDLTDLGTNLFFNAR